MQIQGPALLFLKTPQAFQTDCITKKQKANKQKSSKQGVAFNLKLSKRGLQPEDLSKAERFRRNKSGIWS